MYYVNYSLKKKKTILKFSNINLSYYSNKQHIFYYVKCFFKITLNENNR